MDLSKPILGRNRKEVNTPKWEEVSSVKMRTVAYKQIRNAFWEVIHFPELKKAGINIELHVNLLSLTKEEEDYTQLERYFYQLTKL